MNLFGTVGLHRPCDLVFIGGVCTVRDGALTRIDEQATYREAQREVKRLLNG